MATVHGRGCAAEYSSRRLTWQWSGLRPLNEAANLVRDTIHLRIQLWVCEQRHLLENCCQLAHLETLDGGIMISAMEKTWQPFRSGSTLGKTGTEAGVILRDEEHIEGARITLERSATKKLLRRPVVQFAITCGIYGWMVHTRFFSSEEKAVREYDRMKPGFHSRRLTWRWSGLRPAPLPYTLTGCAAGRSRSP